MTKYMRIENYVYDMSQITNALLCEFISDNDLDNAEMIVIERDDDGAPLEFDHQPVGTDRLMEMANATEISADEALAAISNGWNYAGVDLNEEIAIMNADPAFIQIVKKIKTAMSALGWTVRRHKNNSVYFYDGERESRFSNHYLGESQGQWLYCDVVFEPNMTVKQITQELIHG